MRKSIGIILGLVMALTILPMTVFASDDARNYTYKITPILPPFNSYFFVETDNPNPKSFRFEDKERKYIPRPYILQNAGLSDKPTIFADIHYENEETGRVNGGYIFYGGGTDGGEISLLVSDDPDAYYPTYKDTGITLTLPKLQNSTDYLVDTYATKGSFFDNMDAVQSALRSIAVYSGSKTKGKLVQDKEFWMLGVSGHVDQSFYKYSPYDRTEERSLFASAIYPYKLDSLGFPGMLESVAEALDSTVTVKPNSSAHYLIDVTYHGETRTYGGAGSLEGQAIPEDQIQPYFSFGAGGTEITLDGIYGILWSYAKTTYPFDVPREGMLTWEDVYATVGSGSWVRLSDGGKDPSAPAYSYMYQDGDGTNFRSGYFDPGHEYYTEGDLGYASDVWVDGRYVDDREKFVPGETFADHPDSDILMKDVTVPQVAYSTTYKKNETTGEYEPVYSVKGEPRTVTKTVLFKYKGGNLWVATGIDEGGDYADYDIIRELAYSGKLDVRYLYMTYFIRRQVETMGIDANTNVAPDKGFIYDGTAYPGTPYDHATAHCWDYGKVVKDAKCDVAGEKRYTCEVCGLTRSETIPAPGHQWDEDYRINKYPTCTQDGSKVTFCYRCGESRTEPIPALGHKWGKVSYKITKDYSKVIASRMCENDNSHVETETANTTEIVTKEPTCTEPGETIYRAVFENPAFGPAKKTVTVSALGHDWDEGVITAYPTADAEGERTFTCGRCGQTRKESIPKDVNEITPSAAMAEAAPVDPQVPVVNTGKIRTTGNFTKKQMKVKFPADGVVDNYRIQFRPAGEKKWTSGWSAGTDHFTIQGIPKYSLCEFRIAGFVKQADGSWVRGGWSKVSYRYMSAVSLKNAKAGKKSITVTWAKDAKSSGYQIQISRKSNMSKATTITVKGKAKTKHTIKNLKSGKKYYVKVRPIKTKSGKTYVGILTKGKAVKVR